MAATGAADGDRHIAAIAVSKRRQPAFYEMMNVIKHVVAGLVLLEEIDDGVIAGVVPDVPSSPEVARLRARFERVREGQWHHRETQQGDRGCQ